jgi:DNA mismatch repair protein MutS2
VGSAAREAANYLQRIKREAEDAEAFRRALDEEREAVAEKYARLDVEARNRERERESAFEKQLRLTVQDFERRSKELVEQIQDRAERIRVERETQRRVSELKREAQAAAKSASTSVTGGRRSEPQPVGGIRVVRDGKVVEKRQQDSPESADVISAPPSRPIEKGDQVRLKSFGSIGLVDSIAGENAEVRVGSIRLREKLSNLELIEKPVAAPAESRGARLRASKGTDFKLRESAPDVQSELKLIGRTTDEAVDETDKFLDEAFMNGIQHLRIIHGHGTGALRRVIHNLLKNHPHVAQYSQAPPDQGGAGATIVELKQ